MMPRPFSPFAFGFVFVAGLAMAFIPTDALAQRKSAKSSKAPVADENAPTAPHSPTITQMPWSLRDIYTFTQGKHQLVVAIETGLWRLLVEGQGAVIDDAGFSITFADGSVWDSSNMGKAATERNPYEDALGKATDFWLEFPSRGSIVVREEILMYEAQPFLLFRLLIGNNSEKPIEVAKISQMVPGPNGITNFGAATDASFRRVAIRGGCPVFDKSAGPALAVFNDKTNGWTLGLGVLSGGSGVSKAEFKPAGPGTYQGEISCTFNPPIRIDPGTKFQGDPLWLSFSLPAPGKVDMYYGWSVAQQPHIDLPDGAPLSWATADADCSEADLYALAQEWAPAQVKHVLVPYGWEGRPGSLEGALPRFPKSMEKVAEKLRGLGMKPGLTVDPLLTNETNADFTAATSDGRRWINLGKPEGRQKAVASMRKVAGWGFDFFAVAPSSIPDEALGHFAMSRAQADQLAMGVMAEAAEGKPVLPTAAPAPLKPVLEDWLEAAAGSSRMSEFGLPVGPVRFDVTGVGELEPAVRSAMSFYRGPIEFMGRPSAELKRQLAEFLPQARTVGRPLDSAKESPRMWQVPTWCQSKRAGSSVVAFPGADGLDVGQVEVEPGEQVRIWSAADGQLVDSAQPVVPVGESVSVFGVSAASDYPALLGASYGFSLLLNDVKDLIWDAQKGILTGEFQGSNTSSATAYVAVPEGWLLETGKVEGGALKKGATNCIQFPVAAGKSTRFTLQFSRK
ncbi:MAG: hypothetical protein NTZ09_17855 [Candidatus Hydrogenedentes bacterium]|nr:hypothetical protein [Candidatus Hydrogenedentota bacterium]